MDIASIDLNLLVVLDTLLITRSVTQAARKLNLSQSATSSALGRLRDSLGDPLLIRTAQGMLPTPRAEELQVPVREALAGLSRALTRAERFRPETSTRLFCMRATDYVQGIVMPPLLADVAACAPGIRLNIKPPVGNLLASELATGDVDLVLAPWGDAPAGFYKQKLFSERFLTVVRSGHPRVGDHLDLEQFLELKHVVISFRGDMAGPLDQALEERGLRRQVAVAVPYFHIALALVAASDLAVTLPERLALVYAKQFSLRTFKPPLPVAGFSIFQFWHERTHDADEHKWLRRRVMAAASDVP